MSGCSGSRQLGLDEVSSPVGIVPMHGHELGAASKSVLARQTRAIGRLLPTRRLSHSGSAPFVCKYAGSQGTIRAVRDPVNRSAADTDVRAVPKLTVRGRFPSPLRTRILLQQSRIQGFQFFGNRSLGPRKGHFGPRNPTSALTLQFQRDAQLSLDESQPRLTTTRPRTAP
jgi:hypothetical protein